MVNIPSLVLKDIAPTRCGGNNSAPNPDYFFRVLFEPVFVRAPYDKYVGRSLDKGSVRRFIALTSEFLCTESMLFL